MLIQIAGSQGSGKSTILTKIKELGFPIIERKTSRSILAEWNVTLDEVNSDTTLTKNFQDEIIERKRRDEEEAAKADHVVFGERTFSDLFTYALFSLGSQDDCSDWLNEYYHKCITYNQIYSGVFYLRAGSFAVESDGVRGSNQHYSRLIDIGMLDITQQMIRNSKLTLIETPDLEQRVNIIIAQSKSIGDT